MDRWHLHRVFVNRIVFLKEHAHRMMTHTNGKSSIDMYNNDVGQESAQKFMKETGDLKAATLYFASDRFQFHGLLRNIPTRFSGSPGVS